MTDDLRKAVRDDTALARRRWLLLAAAAIVVLYLAGLRSTPLFEPDEGRYGEIPREMLASHDFVTPRLDGVLYFEKPPLYYWLNAAAIEVFGANAFACRIWNALLALSGIAGTYLLGRRMGGVRLGLLGAGILASLPLYLALAHVNTIDMTLSIALFATLAAFWFAHEEPPGARRTLLWLGMFAAAALTVLTKGLIGIVFPGAIVFFYLLATRRFRVLAQVPWLSGIALFLAIALPWHVLMAQRHPDFLWFYFVHEQFLRYSTKVAQRPGPIYYFVATLILGALPWTGLLPGLFRRPATGGEEATAAEKVRLRDLPVRHPDLAYLWIWFGFILLFFSVSKSKLIPYILPAVPPFALLLARAAEPLVAGARRLARWETAALALAWLLTALPGVVLVLAAQPIGGRLMRTGRAYPELLLPGLAVLAAMVLLVPLLVRGAWMRRIGALFAFALTLSAALVYGARFAAVDRSSRDLAQAVAAQVEPAVPLFAYRDFPEGLPFYLRRTIGIAQYRGELDFGISHLAESERKERFPTAAELRPLWDGPGAVYLVTPEKMLPKLAADGLLHPRTLWQGGKYVLLSNQGEGHGPPPDSVPEAR